MGQTINQRLGELRERCDAACFDDKDRQRLWNSGYADIQEGLAIEAVRALSDFANQSVATPEDFVAQFVREHRTLQQGMFALFMAVVEEMAKPDFAHDMRSEDSVAISREIVEKIERRRVRFI